jgi:DNA-binding response OmpR family regulator
MAHDSRPDVILLDIGMPGMNGYEVARQLRAQAAFSDTLLVAVTGYGRASDVKQTESAGFDHHLVKPIDYEKLQSLLAARAHNSGKTSPDRAGERVDVRGSFFALIQPGGGTAPVIHGPAAALTYRWTDLCREPSWP